jgi:hypothetical protein
MVMNKVYLIYGLLFLSLFFICCISKAQTPPQNTTHPGNNTGVSSQLSKEEILKIPLYKNAVIKQELDNLKNYNSVSVSFQDCEKIKINLMNKCTWNNNECIVPYTENGKPFKMRFGVNDSTCKDSVFIDSEGVKPFSKELKRLAKNDKNAFMILATKFTITINRNNEIATLNDSLKTPLQTLKDYSPNCHNRALLFASLIKAEYPYSNIRLISIFRNNYEIYHEVVEVDGIVYDPFGVVTFFENPDLSKFSHITFKDIQKDTAFSLIQSTEYTPIRIIAGVDTELSILAAYDTQTKKAFWFDSVEDARKWAK